MLAVGIGGFLLFIYGIGDLNWSLSRKLLILALFVALGFYVPEYAADQPHPAPAEIDPEGHARCSGPADHLR